MAAHSLSRFHFPFSILLLVSACSFPSYREGPPFDRPPSEVLPAVIETLDRYRFRLISAGPGLVEAAQPAELSPFAQEGIRRKAEVRIEEGPEGTVVGVLVMREVNANITAPTDERAADWGGGESDGEMEDLLLYGICEKLSPARLQPGARQ